VTTVVLLSYGSMVEARRALFAAHSVFAHLPIPSEITKVLIFTDQRRSFEPSLRKLPIDYVELTREWMEEVIRPFGYIHRLKIAVIDEAIRRTNGSVLFLDSDTFCMSNLNRIAKLITEGHCVMHFREHTFATLRHFPLPGTVQAIYRFMNGGTVTLTSGNELRLSDSLLSWNSGVVGLHRTHARFLPDVFAVCDQIYAATENRVSEQYAFDVVLQKNLAIRPADSVVYHYWHDVKKKIFDEFIDTRVNELWLASDLESRFAAVRDWTQELPDHIATHPLALEDMALRCLAEKRRAAALVWAARGVSRRKRLNPAFTRRFIQELRRTLQ